MAEHSTQCQSSEALISASAACKGVQEVSVSDFPPNSRFTSVIAKIQHETLWLHFSWAMEANRGLGLSYRWFFNHYVLPSQFHNLFIGTYVGITKCSHDEALARKIPSKVYICPMEVYVLFEMVLWHCLSPPLVM